MDTIVVVPLVAKPAHAITEPLQNSRLQKEEKKRFVFPQVILIMTKNIWSVQIIFFFLSENTSFHRDPKETYFIANSNLSSFAVL